MEYLIIVFICVFIILFWQFFKLKKKLKETEQQQIEEVYKIKLEKVKDRVEKDTELIKKSYEAICQETEKASKRLVEIDRQIVEKTNFNESLKKIREEELNRLVEEKKKEKLKNLENELLIEKQKQLMNVNAEVSLKRTIESTNFLKFCMEKDEERNRILGELDKIRNELDDFRLRREGINEAILREKELQEKEDFYKIDVPQGAQDDILVLEQIRPQLKNREALSKLIWDVFIQRPTAEMIKRITAGRDVSGIYKITYIKTGESYIGKTTNIKTRWQNHVKTVVGLEGAAHSTLHTHMEKHGLWNYTYEILEEVPKDKLTEREKIYINLYDTTKQLNMREG